MEQILEIESGSGQPIDRNRQYEDHLHAMPIETLVYAARRQHTLTQSLFVRSHCGMLQKPAVFSEQCSAHYAFARPLGTPIKSLLCHNCAVVYSAPARRQIVIYMLYIGIDRDRLVGRRTHRD